MNQKSFLCCYNRRMSTENINLTENQREVLRAFLTLDLKPTSDVAALIGVSRSTLTFALDGKRSLSEDTVNKLLDVFGISNWEPDPGVAHYLRVGSDIEPLQVLVNTVFESAKMYYVKPFGKVDLELPWTGLFLLEYDNFATGKGLLLVHRDKMRSGKGVVSISADHAKPITPDAFKNIAWADQPELVLPDDVVRKLEAPFYRQADTIQLSELRRLLNLSAEVNWVDVRKAAEAAHMSADYVLKLIERAQTH
jgi:transcriptional regulator with XRE-family HTH domain